jgi:transposase
MEAQRMLADICDVVIGVDTHRDTHTLAAVQAYSGAVLEVCRVSADAAGYQAALVFAAQHAAGRRVWALEGSGCWGVGLARVLVGVGERVVEIDRPNRGTKRSNAKDDTLDAIRAAATALSRERLATPRVGVTHDALRVLLTTREGAVQARTKAVNELRALVSTAPDALRARLRGQTTPALVRCTRGLRRSAKTPLDVRAAILAIQTLARQIEALTRDVDEFEREIQTIVAEHNPELLAQSGVGPICAARILVSWAQPGRIRSEAAFAQLAGAAPIPASSGQRIRHRLNRGGDRQLNRALHTIILSRLKHDPETRAYYNRVTADKKSRRDAIRILKRYLARRLYRLLKTTPTPTTIGPRP